MGKLKNKQSNDGKQFTLTQNEYDFVGQVQALRQAMASVYTEQGRLAGLFLNSVAKSRLGYKEDASLEFEIDFEKNNKVLVIREITTDKESVATQL
jgi:hypothetical protein